MNIPALVKIAEKLIKNPRIGGSLKKIRKLDKNLNDNVWRAIKHLYFTIFH